MSGLGSLNADPQGRNKQGKGSNFKLPCGEEQTHRGGIQQGKGSNFKFHCEEEQHRCLTEVDESRFTPATHTCALTHHRTKALYRSPPSFVCSPPPQLLLKIIPVSLSSNRIY
ncbi:hypothetical protein CDAR_435581 [Caerostris darwini]|uniref:Uncharacterized protein n=1 Tax=Caerostris darwini TaxID=1538125 RepID=A0AAV4VJR4_9ARAC|nr:hypothetical protein CDAR_435581 [Caerostris darwini]